MFNTDTNFVQTEWIKAILMKSKWKLQQKLYCMSKRDYILKN